MFFFNFSYVNLLTIYTAIFKSTERIRCDVPLARDSDYLLLVGVAISLIS